MADVKWIKVATDIFDDEKILLIKSMPKSDTLLVIWFELLCFAGKQNNSGVFLLNNKTPFTYKMLATIFKRNEKIVKEALNIFEGFGMIEIVDDVITIPNWGKHQNLDQIESKKAYMKNYMQGYRERQKDIVCKTNCKTNVSRTDCKTNVSRTEGEGYNKELYKQDSYIERGEIINNNPAREETNPEPSPSAYGQFKNVLLSDGELSKLKKAFPDWADKIEHLSCYLEDTGKTYSSHFETIKRWAREDAAKARKQIQGKNGFKNYSGDETLTDFEKNQIQKRMRTQ